LQSLGYKESVNICRDAFDKFLDSDEYYGFCTPGILSKYAVKKGIYPGKLSVLANDVAFDFKIVCEEQNVYFCPACSKALNNMHPEKVLSCDIVLKLLAEHPIEYVLKKLKIKRRTTESNLYQILGSAKIRNKFKDLGWTAADLPFLPTALYGKMVRFIVEHDITTLTALKFHINQHMKVGMNWWQSGNIKLTEIASGFIYLAVVDSYDEQCSIKIGLTEREVRHRHGEHIRDKRISRDSLFLSKHVSYPSREEDDIKIYLADNGSLIKGREEFLVSPKVLLIVKNYLISSKPFKEFLL